MSHNVGWNYVTYSHTPYTSLKASKSRQEMKKRNSSRKMIPRRHRYPLPFNSFLNLNRKYRSKFYYLSNDRQENQQPSSSSLAAWTSTLSSSTPRSTKRGLALVLGVANQRSIAWACVQSFLQKNYDCIITYHIPSTSFNDNEGQGQNPTEKYKLKIEQLALPYMQSQQENTGNSGTAEPLPPPPPPRILACIPCNVQTDIPKLCQELLPNVLLCNQGGPYRTIDTIVHSIAYASEMDRPLLQVSSTAYLQAQHVSAYSLIELLRECVQHRLLSHTNASVTTLSYLGAVRTVPNYGTMSPAKAALECIVRTLAYEVGRIDYGASKGDDDGGTDVASKTTATNPIRVNAVSAGPLKTISARGIPNFIMMQQHVADMAPLRRNVTLEEVAETITWLSISGTGITGQTIYVDAGYSSIVPIGKE